MGTGPSGADRQVVREPVPKVKLALALVGAVLSLAFMAYLSSDAGSDVPDEVLAGGVLLLGLATLGFGLLASERAIMRSAAKSRSWHSPRALRGLYVIGGVLFTLLGVSALLFG